MKELGEHGPAFHAELALPLRAAEVDAVIMVGDEMLPLAGELGKSAATALGKPMSFAHCSSVGEALAALGKLGLQADDAILVKGSNSVGLGAVVAALTQNKD
jgi:UDP-N-acetylmuramoyl-tripeptide--D-alanyl-D-alanine ligase